MAEENSESGPAAAKQFRGPWGKALGALVFVGAVLTAVVTIKDNWGKLSGGEDPPPKLSLIDPTVSLSAEVPNIRVPRGYLPGIEYREDRPADDEVGKRILIDLAKLHEGNGLGAVVGGIFVRPSDVLTINVASAFVNAPLRLKPLRESMGPQLDHTKVAVVGALRYASPDINLYHYAIADSDYFDGGARLTFMRVGIKKETDAAVESCHVRLIDSAGKVQTSANGIDLPRGNWTNYFDFGLLLIDTEVGAKLKVYLLCLYAGHPVGSEMVPFVVQE